MHTNSNLRGPSGGVPSSIAACVGAFRASLHLIHCVASHSRLQTILHGLKLGASMHPHLSQHRNPPLRHMDFSAAFISRCLARSDDLFYARHKLRLGMRRTCKAVLKSQFVQWRNNTDPVDR